MIEYEDLLKQTRIYTTLKEEAKTGSLSHCIMIISEDEIACRNLCRLIARMLLCENDDCGFCKTCRNVESGLHPSLIIPDSLLAQGIKDFIPRCYTVTEGKLKVALIEDFQEIAQREQNRLLKLIEEPEKDTVFIMGVTKITSVLDTIRSRATKLTLDPFTNKELRDALSYKYDDYVIDKAIAFAEGSLTKAIGIIDNTNFIGCYNTMLNIFHDMERSSGLLEIVARVPLRTKKTVKEKCEMLEQYLDAFEIVLKQVLEYKSGINTEVDDTIKQISDKYNMATLVNVEDLILDTKQKAENFCDAEGALYQLLMDILEVKFKCQL